MQQRRALWRQTRGCRRRRPASPSTPCDPPSGRASLGSLAATSTCEDSPPHHVMGPANTRRAVPARKPRSTKHLQERSPTSRDGTRNHPSGRASFGYPAASSTCEDGPHIRWWDSHSTIWSCQLKEPRSIKHLQGRSLISRGGTQAHWKTSDTSLHTFKMLQCKPAHVLVRTENLRLLCYVDGYRDT